MAVWSWRVHSTDTRLEVAQEICEEIGPEYLATSTHEEFKEQAELFKRGHGFLMCIRARDGTHIPIRGSFGRRKLVWCFTDFYSVVLQIVARADYHILTATADHAGKSNDSTIMKKKTLLAEKRRNFPSGARVIEGVQGSLPISTTGIQVQG